MARGRRRVEKDSDTHAPHSFLFFFFSYLFPFLEGLEPRHIPVSPAPLPSLQPLQVSRPMSPGAPGAGPPHRASPGGPQPSAGANGGARGQRGRRRDPFSPSLLWPLKRWLCSQVDMPHVECKDQEPQLLGESKEQPQGEESREEEAGRGPAR